MPTSTTERECVMAMLGDRAFTRVVLRCCVLVVALWLVYLVGSTAQVVQNQVVTGVGKLWMVQRLWRYL